MFTDRTRPIRVAILSALAGGATLAGEVLGSRLLRPVVGSTAASQAGSVAGVLGGLGLGAWWVTRPRRAVRPRDVVLASMAALGVLACAAPSLARLAMPWTSRALVAVAVRSPLLGTLAGVGVAVLFTVPIGWTSGVTYPALAALHGRGPGRATAVTGAASSVGAALTTLVVVFGLAPAVGVRASLWGAAVLYALAGLLVLTFDRTDRDGIGTASEHPFLNADVFRVQRSLVLVGAASVMWQLALARLGVLAFGPSALALAAATAMYTLSLGTGEGALAAWADRVSVPRVAWRRVLLAAATLAVGCTALAAQLPAWSASRFAGHVPSMARLWLSAMVYLFVLTAPVIGLVGASMPLAARVLGDAGLGRASANARVLGAMAIGNVIGALAGGLWLVPWLTLSGVLLASAALLFVASSPERAAPRNHFMAYAALAVALMGGGHWARAQWSATSLSRGPFLYTGAEDLDLGQIVSMREGREATVVVRRDEAGEFILQIDGKVDATSGGDTATQTLVSIVPAVLSAHPSRVLVIGLGSGMTVDAVREVPGVHHVDVTELLPEVIDAARTYFRGANHAVLESPSVRALALDASLFLRGTHDRYDVIVSEPSNPWVAGMADLFTHEALDAARARLTPGGVMSAWFHAYSSDAATFASIVGTFREVFPRCALIEMVAGQDYMLVGVIDPVHTDVDRMLDAIHSTAVRTQLERAGIHDPGAFLGRFLAGPAGITAIARDAESLRADDLRLEFRAPFLLYNDASDDIFALLLRAQDLPLAGLAPTGSRYLTALDDSEPARESGFHARQMAIARARHDYEAAIAQGNEAVAANPADDAVRTQLARVYLMRAGRRYRREHDPGGAEDDVQNALELRPGPVELFRARVVHGDMLLARNDFVRAAQEYGAALEIGRVTQSPSPELHVRMAQVLVALNDVPHARAELDRAMRDCTDPERLREIEQARTALGEGPVPAPH